MDLSFIKITQMNFALVWGQNFQQFLKYPYTHCFWIMLVTVNTYLHKTLSTSMIVKSKYQSTLLKVESAVCLSVSSVQPRMNSLYEGKEE